mgnify:CR=1 FL=1
MKLARYVGEGRISIEEELEPTLPPGGLLVRTEASGLCSGELMEWYMERKIPHVLGHEVSGIVAASDDDRFPVGSRVAPHHHAPCGTCDFCRTGRPVHCETWKRTKLVPGGMAERFAVAAENLADTHRVDKLRPQDAALIEPLGCVAKSLHRIGATEGKVAVIGLGTMGLMHMLALGDRAFGIEISPTRLDWAKKLGLNVGPEGDSDGFDAVIVCPGTPTALDSAFRLATPGAVVTLFAPLAPGEEAKIPWDRLYFKEISLVPSYSCGPEDTAQALRWIEDGTVRAEQVVSHFIGISELPKAYVAMKRGEILKAMVMFD